MTTKRTYKKRSTWSDAAESLLVQLWEENIENLRGNRKNSHVFQEISEGINNFGHIFTSNEIRIKIHNLTSKYRMEKKRIGPSGGSPSTWPLYNRIHSIIGHHKCNQVEELMEDNLDVMEPNLSIEILDDFESEDFFLDESEESILQSNTEEPTPSTSCKSPSEKREKGRKRSFQEEILQQLKESKDIMQQDLEERNKIDQKMLKMQEELVELEREKISILKKWSV